MTRRIALVGYPSANALDVTGPCGVFSAANGLTAGAAAYELLLLSPDGGPIRTGSGLTFMADAALADAPELDTLIVPGGAGLRTDAELRGRLAGWVAERAPRTRRVVSVCTGFYALAASGVLDGRRATTHWRHAADAAKRFPQVRLEPDAIFIRDGAFATSAGITAGIDLALALVEEDLGPSISLAVARELVVYLKRSGGQLQYSEPLRFQVRASGRLADLAAWMPGHLGEDLSIERLASRVNFSPRHFARVFKQTFGLTPAEHVEQLRLDEAAARLLASALTLEAIAHSVGYQGGDTFRRAFERRFGVPPSAYRERFAAAAA
ncbi:MAG: AraC family transcriptional regulator [Phenylobacterium sp.]|nr:AraC family transcriptional regulator [Phenylobacterium sp.]